MAAKRSGLGRGIGALIPAQAPESDSAVDVFFGSDDSSLEAVPGLALKDIPVSDITPNERQPRSEFRAEELQELTHSIREFGVLQPIVVRPRAAASAADAPFELIMGERRLRAATAAGLTTIPAIVRDTSDANMLRDALLENLHRADLNPLEEASAYQQLLNDFGTTQQELADRIGRSRPQVTNTLRLLNLAPPVQVHVAAGVLSAGHARALLGVSDPDAQAALAQDIISQSLTVRQAEERAGSGSSQKKAARTSRPGGRASQLDELAEELGDRLNTRVKISLSRTKGQLTIDFATVADLNRILGDLGMEGFPPSQK
jgi:ParB family chromosome partitioning protein